MWICTAGVDSQMSPLRLIAVAERIPDADRALRAEAEALEGALAGEIGQEGARRQLVGVAGEDRRAQVAEDRVHRGVAGVGLEPVLGRLPSVGKVAGAGVGEFLQDARGLLGQLPEQQRPAAAADIDQLAVDEEGTGGLRGADIERRADGIEGLLEYPAQFDRDGADIDREAVDLLGRGASADPVLVVDDEGMKPGMGQAAPRRKARRHRPRSRQHPPEQPSFHLPKRAARLIRAVS